MSYSIQIITALVQRSLPTANRPVLSLNPQLFFIIWFPFPSNLRMSGTQVPSDNQNFPNSSNEKNDKYSDASIAAAIANFRPSSKDVISGIAPHVLDERKRRRRRVSRNSYGRRPPSRGLVVESSPLRTTAFPYAKEFGPTRSDDCDSNKQELCRSQDTKSIPSPGKQQSRWPGFRIDSRLFRSIIVKFRVTRPPGRA